MQRVMSAAKRILVAKVRATFRVFCRREREGDDVPWE